jgi:hypothetical protein
MITFHHSIFHFYSHFHLHSDRFSPFFERKRILSLNPLGGLGLLDRIWNRGQPPVAHTRASALPRKVHANLELIRALE